MRNARRWIEQAISVAAWVWSLVRTRGWGLVLLFAALAFSLWAFAGLAEEVHEDGALAFDEPVLRFAQQISGDGLDAVFLFFSAIGYAYGVIPTAVALIGGLLVVRRFRSAVFAIFAICGSALLNVVAKNLFSRDRPSLWDSIAPEATYSFPSAHAMGSMTLAAVVILLAWNSRWRLVVLAIMAVVVAMVGLSRVYLGVHYPSDILAGWTAAVAWVLGCYAVVFGRPHWRTWRRRRDTPAKAAQT